MPVRTFGVPQRFLDHAKRAKILADAGLTGQDLARKITEVVAQRSSGLQEHPTREIPATD